MSGCEKLNAAPGGQERTIFTTHGLPWHTCSLSQTVTENRCANSLNGNLRGSASELSLRRSATSSQRRSTAG